MKSVISPLRIQCYWRRVLFCLSLLELLILPRLMAQEGITVDQSVFYFYNNTKDEIRQVRVFNNDQKDSVKLSLSLRDWKYDSLGNMVIFAPNVLNNSCARNIRILSDIHLSIPPASYKDLQIMFYPDTPLPSDSILSRTAMILLLQEDSKVMGTRNGSSIHLAVGLGLKIYDFLGPVQSPKLDISDLAFSVLKKKSPPCLALKFYNRGNIWVNGSIHWSVLNKNTGKKFEAMQKFASLPFDYRIMRWFVPDNFPHGDYSAIAYLDIGGKSDIDVAQLDFEY